MRLLLIVASLSMAVIFTLTSVGIYHLFRAEIIADAERDAVQVSQGILASESQSLLFSESEEAQVLAVGPGDVVMLDSALTRYLAAFEIVKIKLYDTTGIILYSTDHSIIGKADVGNERLARALAGENDSKLERKGEFLDLAAETRIDVDVVETYVPIRNDAGAIVGAFEIYQDVTRAKAGITETAVAASLALLGIMLVVFGLSFLVVRAATDRLKEAQRALEAQARMDSLTGLNNRGSIYRRALAEFNRMSRHVEAGDHALGLVLADVDHFKHVNDEHGHAVGDEVLVEMARRLQHTLRSYDAVGRYGGEEFLVIVPDTTLEKAGAVAERLRRAVEAVPFETQKGPLDLSISLGVALVDPEDGDIEAALKKADDAMYRAKKAGRNRVGLPEADPDLEAAPA